eukprot:scaffold11177_cov86-Isochrysis_galbana.AAC.2
MRYNTINNTTILGDLKQNIWGGVPKLYGGIIGNWLRRLTTAQTVSPPLQQRRRGQGEPPPRASRNEPHAYAAHLLPPARPAACWGWGLGARLRPLSAASLAASRSLASKSRPRASSSVADAKASLRRAPAGMNRAPMLHTCSHRHAQLPAPSSSLHTEAGGPAAASSRLQSLTERLWPVGRVGVQREACRG